MAPITARAPGGVGVSLLVAACVAIAALSLLAPSVPSSDAWAWLVWGREIAELSLDTTNGPSWKPLPIVFTAPLSLLGDAQPALWLVVARAGGLLAVVFSYRLAERIAREVVGPRLAVAAGVLAGAALVSTDWLAYIARGEAEPLVLALLLWALERHLDGHHNQALVLALLGALGRPEVWPLLGVQWVWVWLRAPRSRRTVVVCALLLAGLWFGLDWWGSGQPLLAGERANRPTPSSLADADRPTLAVLIRTARLVVLPILALALVGTALAAVERRVLPLGLAAGAGLWTLVVAVLTEGGYTGNERYLFPVAGALCVLAGVGFGRIARGAGGGRRSVAVTALLVASLVAFLPARGQVLLAEVRETRAQERARAELATAIERAGGSRALLRRGSPGITRGGYQSALAWELGLSLSEVRRPFPPRDLLQLDPPNVILDAARARGEDRRRRPWLSRPELVAEPLARAGFWRVVEVRRRGPPRRAASGARAR